MISLHYLHENMVKIRENKRKLTSQTLRRTSGFLYLKPRTAHRVTMATFPPSQRGPGSHEILHGRHGFSIRSSYVQRGIIKSFHWFVVSLLLWLQLGISIASLKSIYILS